jgi:hypothetical protein
MRVREARNLGETPSRSEALGRATEPGDAVIVKRGHVRALVLNCPDGCGEKLTINLDRNAGKAWRLYSELDSLTLYPSVWRSTGCRSHFILWSDRFYWNDLLDPPSDRSRMNAVQSQILESIAGNDFFSAEDVAAKLGESPWLVHMACQRLVRDKLLQETEQNGIPFFRKFAD